MEIGPDAVDLWVIDLSGASLVTGTGAASHASSPLTAATVGDGAHLWACTSRDEQARAARFRRQSDGGRYLTAHGALRRILSGYLDCDPSTLRFEHQAWGKPALVDSEFAFNLSHSGECALVAVARGRPVGVDVEQHRPIADLDGLVERVCTPEERAMFAAARVSERQDTFLGFWTRKEALAKMTGVGLRALDPVASLHTGTLVEHRLEQLEDLPGYAACVAATGTDWRLVRRN